MAAQPGWSSSPGTDDDGPAGQRDSSAGIASVPSTKGSQMGAGIPNLPPPTFIDDADGLNPNLILADMIAAFQPAAGRTLQPAQVERLLVNLYAYRESLVRNAIQYAGEQNLLAYAAFPMLDYLGQLLSVSRLPAQAESTTRQCTLANTLSVSYTVVAGTAVGSSDGQFVFVTVTDLTIAEG